MKIESDVSNNPISKLQNLVADILNKRNREMKEASNKYDAIQNEIEQKGKFIDVRV